MSWDSSSLEIKIDEMTVPFPSRIHGTVRVFPAAVTSDIFTLNQDGNHSWWPIAPHCRVEVTLDQPALHWKGEGYFDTNSGDVQLEDGFTTWDWSRASTKTGTAIFYDVKKRGGGKAELALLCDMSGRIQAFDPPPRAKLATSGWRVARHTRSEGPAQVVRTLEDAPFYARSLVSGKLFGEPVTMVHESLSLDRFRMPVVQAMLPFRMPRARR